MFEAGFPVQSRLVNFVYKGAIFSVIGLLAGEGDDAAARSQAVGPPCEGPHPQMPGLLAVYYWRCLHSLCCSCGQLLAPLPPTARPAVHARVTFRRLHLAPQLPCFSLHC